MDPQLVARGLVIGFAIAAPIGPIGALCIQRTIARGRAIGFASGLGAASADAVYGAIAALGLAALWGPLLQGSVVLRIVAGAFLLFLGVRTFTSPTPRASRAADVHDLTTAWITTLGLTLANPATILSFLAVFAGLGLAPNSGATAALALVTGVFVGSASWWLLLVSGVGLLRDRFSDRLLSAVNRVSGVVIALIGVAVLASLLV